MAFLFLLLLLNQTKAKTSGVLGAGAPRRQVQGRSGRTWFVRESTQAVGADRTTLLSSQVFQTAHGNDLVIAYVQVPAESLVVFPDGGKPVRSEDVRVLFYAAPGPLTKSAIADFVEA